MRLFSFVGGDVYVAHTACGCNPDASRRAHQCTNASSSWVRCSPRGSETPGDWLRVRAGAGVRVVAAHAAGETYDSVQKMLADYL
jgi:hypothetical protein